MWGFNFEWRIENRGKMHDPNQSPLVPETLLKRRRNLDELAERRIEHINAQGKVCYFLFFCCFIPLVDEFVSRKEEL